MLKGDAADFWLHLKGDSGILILSDSIVLWASVYLCAVSPSVSEEFFGKVGSTHLIPCGVVFSHDRYDLSIRSVTLSTREKNGFVPTLLRQRFRSRLSTSGNFI